jgi:outer membrane lipoprotein carrier protein
MIFFNYFNDRKKLLAVIASILLTIVSLGFAQQVTAAAREELTALLSQLNTMTAHFQQKVFDGQGVLLQTSSGVMDLKRPGLFRWEINKPSKQILYANGDIVWIYDVDLEQASKQKMTSQVGVTPAQLLMGTTDKLANEFHISSEKVAAGTRFKLTPKQASDIFSWVELQFNGQYLTSMRLADNLGQMTTLRFYKVKMNVPIKDSVFKFTPPNGVDVLSAN